MHSFPSEPTSWDDLVNRLVAHDVTYLMGGRERSDCPSATTDHVPVGPLLLDLARAPEARMRSAQIALLLRHPEYATHAIKVAAGLPAGDPTHLQLQAAVLAAASLQREWAFSLRLYLPAMQLIEASALAADLGVPDPDEAYGIPCLRGVAGLLRAGASFPFNYEAEWEGVVHRLLVQLQREPTRGAQSSHT